MRFLNQMSWLLGLMLIGLCLRPSLAATPAEVDASISKAIDALYAKQNDGHWENVAQA